MKKTIVLLSLMLTIVIASTGCQSFLIPGLTKQERAMLAFDLNGVKIGSSPSALSSFAEVIKVPILREGMVAYEIYRPLPQISLAIAYYHNDRLRKLELRYFNGPTERTLAMAGGVDGIRNYLIEQYGPPSRFGPDVALGSTMNGLDPKNANFNGEWIFSRINRHLNFIGAADSKGGVGVVTLLDTTLLDTTQLATTAVDPMQPGQVISTPLSPSARNPGF